MGSLRAVTLAHTEPSNAGLAPQSLIGQTIGGRYRVESLIGSGGMGSVYRALEQPLERAVAIKVLRSEVGAPQSTLLERFEREAATLARLSHPHIVTVYDYGATPHGDLFLVMEYLSGSSLRSLIDRGGALREPVAISIAAQVGRALRKAHAHGVLHRDVKPDNIMTLQDGDELTIKLVDFGVAKFFEPETGNRDGQDWLELTHTGSMIGSPAYMAPEQVLGEELGQWTDIYSLGATLFHMVAGAPPFSGASSYEVIRKQVHQPAPRIEEVSGGQAVSAGLERIIHRCLEKCPEDRYESIDAVLEALAQLWAERREIVPSLEQDAYSICFDSGVVSAQLPLQTELIADRGRAARARKRVATRRAAPQWSWMHWLLLFAVGCFWGLMFANAGPGRERSGAIRVEPMPVELQDPGLSERSELIQASVRRSSAPSVDEKGRVSSEVAKSQTHTEPPVKRRSGSRRRRSRRPMSKKARIQSPAASDPSAEFKVNPF